MDWKKWIVSLAICTVLLVALNGNAIPPVSANERDALTEGDAVAAVYAPCCTITTDKTVYTSGDSMTIYLKLENPQDKYCDKGIYVFVYPKGPSKTWSLYFPEWYEEEFSRTIMVKEDWPNGEYSLVAEVLDSDGFVEYKSQCTFMIV